MDFTRTPARLPRFLVALVTPFRGDGTIDLEAHGRNVTELRQRGIEGFLIAGSTGEGPYLEPGEREQLLATAREALGPEAFLLCGVAAESVRGAGRQIAEAHGGGADAALVLSPTSLVRGRHRLVERYYLDVADASPLPVMIYSVPVFTAYEPPVEVIAKVASHPKVMGMKDSGGHPVRAGRIVAAAGDGFALYTGSSAAIALCMAAGAHGAITSSGNYAPELLLRLVGEAQEGMRAAADAQAELATLCAAIEPYGVAGAKAAARAIGLEPGHPREPLQPLDASEERNVQQAVASGRVSPRRE